MWRQCLGAGPRWRRQGIEALIYLSNVQVQCSVFPLAHLDIRTLSLPSNQYGAVPGLISSSSLIRPARMLCWCGQAALGLQQVSLHIFALHRPVSLMGFERPPCTVRDVDSALVVFVRCSALAECPDLVWLSSLCALFVREFSPGEVNDPVAIGGTKTYFRALPS